MARTWGVWTRAKLNILDKYLNAFLTASKTVDERIYLDAFAGEGRGIDRITNQGFDGSVRIALDAGPPPFTKLRFFELADRAGELESQLMEDYPSRDFKVCEGDSNLTISRALADLSAFKWAPTFAFVDPDGMELAWTTLEDLSIHKRGYRSGGSAKPEFKVEIWMLFPTSGLIRTLALEETKFKDADGERATRLFGDETWKPILDRRRRNEITGAEAREEYVNLMRWRLEQGLQYRWTHPFEIKNEKGDPLYHMILATDNEAGTKIMSDIYTAAEREFPRMLEEARMQRGKHVQGRLFGADDDMVPYEYEPPWDPEGQV